MTTTTRRPPPASRPKKRRTATPDPARETGPARGKADPAPVAEPAGRRRRPVRKPRAPKSAASAATTSKDGTPSGGGPKGTALKGTAPKRAARKGGPKRAVPDVAAPKSAAPARAGSKGAGSKGAVRAGQQAPPRTPFVLLIVALLGGALVSLLLLNTILAEDAFTLTRLQESNKRLEQQRQAYQEEIAREESPAQLAAKARALGMREAERPAFINPSTGRTVGGDLRPVPAGAAAAAGAAAVVGVPGTVVPGDGVPPAGTGRPR